MKYSTISLLLSGYILALFSPILSLFWCSVALLVSPQSNLSLNLYKPLLAIVLALTVAGQKVGSFESDDFENYFNVYTIILNEGSLIIAANLLGNPLELGLPFLFYIISLVFNELNPTQLKFIVALIYSFAAIEVILRAEVNKNASIRAALLISFISLVSLSLFSQLVRQGFSTILIYLFVVTASRWVKFAAVSGAVIFHTTALPIIFIIILLNKKPYATMLLIFIIAIASFYIHPLLDSLGAQEISKLSYVANQNFSTDFTSTDKGNLKTLFIAVAFVIFAGIIKPKIMMQENLRQERNFFIVFSFLFLIFLPLPLISSRITMFFTLFLVGYSVGKFLTSLESRIYIPLIVILSLIKPMMYLDFSSTKSTYWNAYPAISVMPGYFVEAFL